MLFGILVLAACATSPPSSSEAIRVNSSRLQSDRHLLAGTIATIPGYLVSARMIGDNVCFKVLVDETLRFAPELLIENSGHATDPTPDLIDTYQRVDPRLRTTGALGASRREVDVRLESDAATSDLAARAAELGEASPSSRLHQTGKARLDRQSDLQRELTVADSQVAGLARAATPSRATVIQACKRPPTKANEKAVRHALEWLDPLKKPERIENAPNIESLRTELQLFYLERSRRYGWARLPWDEILLTGVFLSEGAAFEDEIVGGIDFEPFLVGIHDAQRGRWLVLDLTFNDGIAKGLMLEVFGKQVPGLVGRAGKSAVSF